MHTLRSWLWLAFAASSVACGSSAATIEGGKPIPEYNRETGKLERLIADRNGDGRPDTWAHMDGLETSHIEIDQNGDGTPDRTEFYTKNPEPNAAIRSVIERAEERGPGGAIVRREFYRMGVLDRVEEDTDGDGRMDKWEHYADGMLARLELDLTGRGFPSRRLIYGSGGDVRVEVDPDGDGIFVPAPADGK